MSISSASMMLDHSAEQREVASTLASLTMAGLSGKAGDKFRDKVEVQAGCETGPSPFDLCAGEKSIGEG
jgi:hypothetical protein